MRGTNIVKGTRAIGQEGELLGVVRGTRVVHMYQEVEKHREIQHRGT